MTYGGARIGQYTKHLIPLPFAYQKFCFRYLYTYQSVSKPLLLSRCQPEAPEAVAPLSVRREHGSAVQADQGLQDVQCGVRRGVGRADADVEWIFEGRGDLVAVV